MSQRRQPLSSAWWVLEIVGGVALGLIMLYTVGNILSRTFMGTPLPAAVELVTRWWMIPLVFGGWILAQPRGEHVRVDFVGDNLGPRLHTSYQVIARILIIGFLVLVTIGGWESAVANMNRGEYGIDTQWPVWMTRFIVPILGGAFIGYLLYEIVTFVRPGRVAAPQPELVVEKGTSDEPTS